MSYKITKSTTKTKNALRLLAAVFIFAATTAGSIPKAHAIGPTVSITSPTASSVQTGTVAIQATSSAGTTSVTFKVSGPYVNYTWPADTTAPYSVNWDTMNGATAGLNKQNYTITATGTSAGGSTAVTTTVQLNNTPYANKVIVVGDSVSQQAFDPDADNTFNYTAGAPASADLLANASTIHMGWKTTNVQATVNNYSIFRWPQKLVVAMGLNEANNNAFFGGDGWTSTDYSNFTTLLNTVHPTTCIALVLPGYLSTATQLDPTYAAEIDKARADIAQMAANRPHTITRDWQTVINANPGYMMQDDGIHLLTPNHNAADNLAAAALGNLNPTDATAAAARQNFYWQAAADCTI